MRLRASPAIKFCLLFLLGAGWGGISACGKTPSATPGIQELPGKALFKAKACYTCHGFGTGPMVGPDLKDLFARRDENWVRRFIMDPVTMTQVDPIAQKLKAEYKTQMPKVAMTPTELDALIAYLKQAGQ